MSSAVIQLVVLAGIAIFLILRLRSVLGTRDGFEKPPAEAPARSEQRRDFQVIEGGPDTDITDYVSESSDAARALAQMKQADPSFNVGEFLRGARGAYEMILMGYENGELDEIEPYLAEDVRDTFVDALAAREDEGLKVEATFVGLRDINITNAGFNADTAEAEITVRFTGELTSVVKDSEGRVIEGNANEIKRQRDVWTFARRMGADDPNWLLVATGG
ncbi:preprotein translocase subunit Tim44 [Maritimibacter sp. 55A14]|uniref:Tim44/TimA family putative adaptor protein n=1 Tax=Maritimibacter sp. 55A14 TaxID=2174844 RepID=UPI000D6213C3|nr:Tim44/TimA family putative adaptor protein [Maritimibacter sp. 55A14]PWE33560.1 preprotein translocase subunit Tim44 [Maritimibacter sp. 55A14]